MSRLDQKERHCLLRALARRCASLLLCAYLRLHIAVQHRPQGRLTSESELGQLAQKMRSRTRIVKGNVIGLRLWHKKSLRRTLAASLTGSVFTAYRLTAGRIFVVSIWCERAKFASIFFKGRVSHDCV